MPHMDVFKKDAFSCASLTASINKLPYMPKMLGARGLFVPKPIRTTTASIEEKNGKLSLIKSAARGSEPNVRSRPQRKLRAFAVPQIPTTGKIMADDITGIRAFGSETELEAVAEVVNDELTAIKNDLEATREYYRTGAIQGIVYDADGSTELWNWFTEFGITETENAIDLTSATADIKGWINQCLRDVTDNLGGTAYTSVECAVGNTAWDLFVGHPKVEGAFDRWQDGAFLREGGAPYSTFNFAQVDFYNYRGAIGDVKFVPDDVFRFYPVGAGDIFIDIMAPGDFIETVGTNGLPYYAKQEAMRFNKGIEIHGQSNCIEMCTRPAALVKGAATVTETLMTGQNPKNPLGSASTPNVTPKVTPKPTK